MNVAERHPHYLAAIGMRFAIVPLMQGKVYRFRGFMLDPQLRRVTYYEKSFTLSTKAFDILLVLAQAGGEIVKKEDLLSAVWHDTFVEEGNLAVYISQLRRILGKYYPDPLIETVSRQGYRLLARVRLADAAATGETHAISIGKPEPTKQPMTTPVANSSSGEIAFPSSAGAQSASSIHALAVLPLSNETRDAQLEHIADELTENIINLLSPRSDLRVLARNSVRRFRHENDTDAREVGQNLGVNSVLVGRVLPAPAERLVVSVELMRVADGSQIWGERYVRRTAEINHLPGEIAAAVKRALQIGDDDAQS